MQNVIIKDLNILGGEPVFRGTRVPFKALTDYLEGGEPLDQFLEQYSSEPGTGDCRDGRSAFQSCGEVVGINTLYLEGGENLNFAIPVNDAKLLLGN